MIGFDNLSLMWHTNDYKQNNYSNYISETIMLRLAQRSDAEHTCRLTTKNQISIDFINDVSFSTMLSTNKY